ncbi:4-hydroxythreonine-4-phosphate dehydrogenase [Desulfonauticus submarinus]|uniref:4-hydroxythreonine-4-phosphate dehydrogenase n=1 Tax=Desulfonauticus submarinus TaxID=206665 RepID=A0A1H0E976_9BACT|nr:4-hydroxythreonine-4-phosphate dehydrogenase PdxA [Desulfonauticus submarinus]SDN78883.1 4-hydroxythreonine-4-phosphate dehydrogenase [Desulfonauticus submarinus]
MLIYTMGDPCGIGPELIVRFCRKNRVEYPLVIVGVEEVLALYCKKNKIKKFWQRVDSIEKREKGIFCVEPKGLSGINLRLGEPSVEGGFVAGKSLELVCDYLKIDKRSVLITGPLNKATLQEAGFNFAGHTEFLASAFNVPFERVCMHFWSPSFGVSLVTTHPPLSLVPSLITIDRIIRCLSLTFQFQQMFNKDVLIGVCGLNPHAGEQGKIGREEIEIIKPAIKEARNKGIPCDGPFPADTLFYRAKHGDYNVVLAMYHDQGLGPLKLLHFGQSVNITLGLPILRCSVDHGTAYDLVGKGVASLTSLEEAFKLGIKYLKRSV